MVFLSATTSLLEALQIESIKELKGQKGGRGGDTFEITTISKSAICCNIP